MSHRISEPKRTMALLLSLLILPVAALGASRGQISSLGAHLGNQPSRQQAYSVIELGSFGGTNCCVVIEVNNRTWVDGTSNLPGDKNFHPFLWVNGRMVDLGTLGGPNSSVGGSNDRGDVTVGGSDTGVPDPLGEDFCTYGTYQICRSFVWYNGARFLIPTLGGNNNDVNTINNKGEVLAFGETATHDPTCIAPQVLGIKAFTWEPKTGEVRVLRPLLGDSDSVGFALNENGQAVGASGICKGGLSSGLAGARHAVLWQSGTPIDLGNLGGATGNAAFGINGFGQVVGNSDLPGDVAFHGFLWQRGVMTDLGTLSGDFVSTANAINDKGQVAMQSCDINFNCRAAIWQDGVMTDLNALIPVGSPLFLLFANSINARGEMVGAAYDQRTGATVPFLAIPRDGEYLSSAQVLARARKINLPDPVRTMLRQQRHSRFFQPATFRP